MPPMTGPETARWLAILGVSIGATFAVFAIWPGLDIAVTGLFFDQADVFRAVDDGWPNLLRLVIWRLSEVLLVTALVAALAGLWTGSDVLGIPRRLWSFIVLLYLLGPGLLVDTVVKPFWGRARPADVEAFGGALPFTPPHVISGACERNCSFPAGEVAGAVALSISAFLILRQLIPARTGHLYRLGLAACLVVPTFTAFQRIAGGRHFLSDSLLSAMFVVVIALLLQTLLFRKRT